MARQLQKYSHNRGRARHPGSVFHLPTVLSVFAAFRYTSLLLAQIRSKLQINYRFGAALNLTHHVQPASLREACSWAICNKRKLQLAYGYPHHLAHSALGLCASLTLEKCLACSRKNNQRRGEPRLSFRGDNRTMAKPSVSKRGSTLVRPHSNKMQMELKMPATPVQGFPNYSVPPFWDKKNGATK